MSNKTIVLVIVMFVVLVAGMFGFAYLKKTEVTPVAEITPEPKSLENKYGVTRIEAKHFFSNGVHTIVGEIPLPTPCDLLTTAATIAESMLEQVTFDFGVINNSQNCAQVVTVGRFNISATSSKEASLTARFMGQPVELNVIEAAPGETPEEYELFTKG